MDVDDFESFFGSMRPRLLRYISRWTDIDTANDLAIQALAAIWNKNLPTPRDSTSLAQLESLTFRVSDGLIRNHTRSRGRQDRLHAAAQLDFLTHPSAVESPEAEAVRLDRLTSLLALLPKAEREAVALVIYGYKVGEIATLLHARPGTISMRLMRARQELRKELEGADDE
ncbi:MAG: RNA polymerase sigma factor [Acidimicrobiales bacterium]